jgi:hypothetical protein
MNDKLERTNERVDRAHFKEKSQDMSSVGLQKLKYGMLKTHSRVTKHYTALFSSSSHTNCFMMWSIYMHVHTKTNSVALSPQANYTDWATATCWRNLVPTFVDRGVSRGQHGGSPMVINLSFLDQSRYFSFMQLLIYPHKGWVNPVPDPLLLRKSGSNGNRNRNHWLSSQELWPLDHRGYACAHRYTKYKQLE